MPLTIGSRDLVAALVLAVLVSLLVLPVVLTDRVYLPRHPKAHDLPWKAPPTEDLAQEPFNQAFSDKMNLLYPDLVHGYSEARDGRFPEWNDQILGGVPHVANPLTAVFYPPNWLYLILKERDPNGPPVSRAAVHRMLVMQAALHVFLAGVFMMLFLRGLGLRALPALIGGIGYAFSGWVAAHLQNTPLVAVMAWVPLGLYAIEGRFRDGRRVWLMLLAFSVAMMWLAGMPQLAILGTVSLFASGAAGVLSRLRQEERDVLLRHAGGFLLFGAVGCLLASIQMAPTLELASYSGHQGRSADDLALERMRPGGYLGLILPRALGNPMERVDPSTRYAARIVLGMTADESHERPNWSERTIYPGVILLFLSILGAFRSRGKRVLPLLVLLALGIALSSSEWIIRFLSTVPAFNVGAPVRGVALLAFVIPAFAAIGVQSLMERRTDQPSILSRIGMTALTGFSVLLLAALLGAYFFETGCLELLVKVLKDAGVERRLGGTEVRPVEEYVAAFRGDFGLFRKDLAWLTLWTVCFTVLMWLLRARPAHAAKWLSLLVLLGIIDLLTFFIPVNLPVRRTELFPETPAIRQLREEMKDSRLMRVSATEDDARVAAHNLFAPNFGLLFGLNDAQGWGGQLPRWYLDLWRGTAVMVSDTGVSGIAVDQVNSPILRLSRVGFLIAGREVAGLEDRLVHRPGPEHRHDLWVYRNPDVLPRAYVVHRARCVPDEEALRLLRSGEVAIESEVLLNRWPEGSTQSSYASEEPAPEVHIEENVPGRLVLSVNTKAPGWLVVTDTWYPGWRATRTASDGIAVSVPVERAMVAYRAIPLVQGTQTIRMEYVPTSITIGGFLTGLAWIGFLLLPLLGGRRPRSPVSPRPPGPKDENERVDS